MLNTNVDSNMTSVTYTGQDRALLVKKINQEQEAGRESIKVGRERGLHNHALCTARGFSYNRIS